MSKTEKIAKLQKRLNALHYGEMQITQENLTPQSIKKGIYRVANYGDECATGSTYFTGTLDEIELYINMVC